MPWIDILIFAVLGVFSGILAGLLGIGGGTITVPFLYLIFHLLGFPKEKIMHLAIGTSLAAMVIASLVATISHAIKRAVLWPLIMYLAPGIIIGSVVGALVAHFLPSKLLAEIFGIFAILLALYFFFPSSKTPRMFSCPKPLLTAIGCGIGTISSLIGVGGGVVTVPILLGLSTPMRNAIATSAASTLFSAVAGSICYIFIGWDATPVKYSWGYIYIPAFLVIGILAVISVPLGVKLAHFLPKKILQRIFACVLAIIGLVMIFQ